MSLDLSGARAAITAIFQTRTVRTRDRATNVTAACGLSANSGGVARGVDGRDEARSTYTLTLPADTSVELRPDEVVTIDEEAGRAFKVVWCPPKSNLNLSRRYGLDEVGR